MKLQNAGFRILWNFSEHLLSVRSLNDGFCDNDSDDDYAELLLRNGWKMKGICFFSSWDHCQRFSPSQISDTPWTGLEPCQDLMSSGFVEWGCAEVSTITRMRHYKRNLQILVNKLKNYKTATFLIIGVKSKHFK